VELYEDGELQPLANSMTAFQWIIGPAVLKPLSGLLYLAQMMMDDEC
jgi:hypothetical protein